MSTHSKLYKNNQLRKYLTHYGYLQIDENLSDDIDGLEAQIQSALNSYQKFYGLNVTGQFDSSTKKQMAQSRCSVYDVKPIENLDDSLLAVRVGKWPRSNLTFGFKNFDCNLPPNDIRSCFAAACQLWSDHSSLVFNEVSSDRADIKIGFFGRNHASHRFCNPGFTSKRMFGHGFFPPTASGADNLAGEIHFNKSVQWTISPSANDDEIDLVTVAAHELGHALGLDHVGLSNALMHANCKRPHRFLDADDITGIQGLYGAS